MLSIENQYFLLRELKKRLSKNGLLIISAPNIYNIFGKALFLLKDHFGINETNIEKGLTFTYYKWNILFIFGVHLVIPIPCIVGDWRSLKIH